MRLSFPTKILFLILMLTTSGTASFAQTVPSAAEIDRLEPRPPDFDRRPLPAHEGLDEKNMGISAAPSHAKHITFTLKNLTINGSTVYGKKDFLALFRSDIGREITLDKVWDIAAEITKRYRKDGYVLSRAYVPAQEIENGKITINVVEGYIDRVSIDKAFANTPAVKQIILALEQEKPVTLRTLERGHLLLSDLPGLDTYQGVLTPLKGGPEGAVRLTFSPRETDEKNNYIGIDSYGSKYLGPYQLSGAWVGQIIPLQETRVSGTTTLPTDELNTLNISHQIPILPDLKLQLDAGYTNANPGFRIKARDIESRAVNAGVSLNYQIIRERLKNLAIRIGLDGRNSDSTITGTDLNTDRIRSVRVTGSYDRTDTLYGYNIINVILSHGLSALGASDKDDLNLSRDGAKPNYTKAEIEVSRIQRITPNWNASFTVNAQKASGSLFSSEEFGFGGPALGRAYDASEISGDDGIAAGIELRYQSLPAQGQINLQPFAFVDIGKVWNKNTGQQKTLSAASTGLGIRFQHPGGIVGALQIALPLNKPVDAPIYGTTGGGPQVSFQLGYSF